MIVRTPRPGYFVWFRAAGLIAMGALSLGGFVPAQAGEVRPLTAAVPDSVFLMTGGKYNPERDFLTEEWAEVWEEFEASGIVEDLAELAGSLMKDEQRAQATEGFERFQALVDAVDWTGMSHGEFVFAERMNRASGPGMGPDMGRPDCVMLYRLDAETAAKNYAGLTALLGAGIDEFYRVSGSALVLEMFLRDGMKLMSIDLLQKLHGGPSLRISIGHREDVLLLSMGEGLRDEMIGLLSGTSEQPAMVDSPRYLRAFAALPRPEDGFEYFDAVNLVGDLQAMMAQIFGAIEADVHRAVEVGDEVGDGDDEAAMWLGVARSVMQRVFSTIGIVEASATVHYTDGRATYDESVALLSGSAQENPFYPVIESGAAIEDFAKFLPKETTGFSVQSGTDLDALYTFVEGSVSELGPVGEDLLAKWAALQEQFGIDVRRDVIGWFDGSSVNASLQIDGREAWISMVKVKDEQKAAAYLELALTQGMEHLTALTSEMPQLSMLSAQVRPVDAEDLAGFHELRFMISPTPILCGVREGWLMFASSPAAVRLSLATSKGEHPNVRTNEALMARALLPEGPVTSIAFEDRTGGAKDATAAIATISMMGGMVAMAIPDEAARANVARLFGMISKLSSVVERIDFFESSASHAVFDGELWRTKSVTNYVDR